MNKAARYKARQERTTKSICREEKTGDMKASPKAPHPRMALNKKSTQ